MKIKTEVDKTKQHQPKPKPNYLASTNYCDPVPETDLIKNKMRAIFSAFASR